jgi:DNA-binding GntR family transcriptional regulator
VIGTAMVAESRGEETRSLTEKAYQMLVRKITRLELAPGTTLADKVLVQALGIGRTPIREALQRLSAEGLVVHRPNRGMFVTDINVESAQHIYEFRAMIDGQAARLAALRASTEEVQELAAMHRSLAAAIDDDDIDGFVDNDRRFYLVLSAAAIFNLHLRLWFLISEKLGDWHEIARAHAEMTRGVVDAIKRGDPDEAELAVKIYIHGRHKEIRQLL